MQRKLVLFGMAIAFLCAISMAVIFRMTRTWPSLASPSPTPAKPTAGTQGGAPFQPPPFVPAPPAGAPVPVDPPPPKPPPRWLQGSTQSLGPAADPSPLGPLRPYVAAGMAKLQMSVARCADEAPAAGSGPPPAGGPRTGTRGRTVLTLELERLDGQLRIADARLGNGAAAGDWRVECAQRKLRGQVIPAPVSKGGDRMQVPFVLKL